MAVERNATASRLVLVVVTGQDELGQPIKRFRSYPRVSVLAEDQDVYDVGEALAALQKHSLSMIQRVDEVDLVDMP
jgi:hypothetical protein